MKPLSIEEMKDVKAAAAGDPWCGCSYTYMDAKLVSWECERVGGILVERHCFYEY